MAHLKKSSSFNFIETSPSQYKITVTIPSEIIDSIYNQAISSQKTSSVTFGFSLGSTPAQYIESTYKIPIIGHIKNLLLSHYVEDRLLSGLLENKISLSGECFLTKTHISPKENALFDFMIQSIKPVGKKNWKELIFKAPVRKNYKDLDRQVESFIKEELNNQKNTPGSSIQIGDIVNFDLALTDEYKKNIFGNYKQNLWLKIGGEEADQDLTNLFINKNIGATIFTQNKQLQEYISADFDIPNHFLITIKSIVNNNYFDFEQLKKHFELKTVKEMESKLIEIFSYRNNLSQRRETVEMVLNLISKNFNAEIPNYILLQHKEKLLENIQENPDYLVYKSQPDFMQKVLQLAKKQLKEIIIIDAIACEEKIDVSNEEISNYLNLLKRNRTKDFVYFLVPSTKIDGLEMPISSQNLRQYCIREKTLNHIINKLTKF